MGDYLANFDLFEVLGWTGQAFFFGRFLLQWLASERAKRIVVPTVFWWMSLAGAVFAGIYAFHEKNLIFLASPVINLFVYSRNLVLLGSGQPLGRRFLLPFACGIAALCGIALLSKLSLEDPPLWLVVGTLGQLCWVSRFPLQWYISERLARATLPPAFFWISFVGSILLLAYAIHTGKPIFIAGMILGPVLYGRSLVLSYRHPPEEPGPPPPTVPSPHQDSTSAADSTP